MPALSPYDVPFLSAYFLLSVFLFIIYKVHIWMSFLSLYDFHFMLCLFVVCLMSALGSLMAFVVPA